MRDEWEAYGTEFHTFFLRQFTLVNEFDRHGQILKLVPVIPIKDPKLEPECYETILRTALYARPKLFKAIVGKWDGELYRVRKSKSLSKS